MQGGLHWWLGQFPEAETELTSYGTAASQALLTLSAAPDHLPQAIEQLPPAAQLVLGAWRSPEKRPTLISQAWMMVTQTPMPAPILQQTLSSLESAPNFYRWLTESAPVLRYRRQRLGFGVNRRHIDGPNPEDYYVVIENLPMVTWFTMMFPSPVFAPAWDEALQPLREKLWQAVEAPGSTGG